MIRKSDLDENTYGNTLYDMIYLMMLGLNDIIPDKDKLEKLDFEGIYLMAQKHSLTSFVYMILESTSGFRYCDNEELIEKWRKDKEKSIRKSILFEVERKKILNYLEKNGIWHMVLKGIVLNEMYPRYGMREMADNDILYDVNYQIELMQYMKSNGYRAEMVKKGNHDIYLKYPVYNFEMHTSLYGNSHNEQLCKYYADVRNRLLKVEGKEFCYQFKEEDLYIYIITHIYKHYDGGGTGLRSILDVFVLLNNKGKVYDWKYVEKEFHMLGLNDFEHEIRNLSFKLFSESEVSLTPEERKSFIYFVNSGTYGTMKNVIEKKLNRLSVENGSITTCTRIKYYCKRIFPDVEYYKQYVPNVYKHKWRIPFFVTFRLFRGILKRGKHIIKEVKLVQSMR